MKLAVIFPGIGYHVDKPLLLYAGKLAEECGYEIRNVPYGNFPTGVKGDAKSGNRKCDQRFGKSKNHYGTKPGIYGKPDMTINVKEMIVEAVADGVLKETEWSAMGELSVELDPIQVQKYLSEFGFGIKYRVISQETGQEVEDLGWNLPDYNAK